MAGCRRGDVARVAGASADAPRGSRIPLFLTLVLAPGPVVRPERTVTLALPKTGLEHVPGQLYLADIGIPPEVFHRLGVLFEPPFEEKSWVRLVT